MQTRDSIALAGSSATMSHAGASNVITRHWMPGEQPINLPGLELAEIGVTHFDVRLGADPVMVYDVLRPICGPDLSLDMIVDLLDPDPLPKIQEQDEDGRVRAVSGFAVSVVPPPPQARSRSGRLSFELVEFLANEHWLITCSHMAQSYAGTGESSKTEGRRCDSLIPQVARRWTTGNFSTAGDLGTLFLHEMTCTYSDAWRGLSLWLECWERRLYDDPELEQDTLRDLRGLVTEFRSRLNAINVPRDEAGSAWFSSVTNAVIAERADRHIDRALNALDRLGDMLRSAYGVLQANTTARQLVLAEKQRESAEKLQRRIELATALFLFPTLIAGMWGENTWVPGHNRPWGFGLTLAVMVLGSFILLSLLRLNRLQRWSS